MRRSVGVGAIQSKKAAEDKYQEKKMVMQDNLVEELSKHLGQFRMKLETFAAKHRLALQKDPEFRMYFQKMCASIGVDPLASSKGFWSELLGTGTFYYELAIQVVEIVLATAHLNGGIMQMSEMHRRLNSRRNAIGKNTKITIDDIERAVKTLTVLGNGCAYYTGGPDKLEDGLIFCVPEELSLDNTRLIQIVSNSGNCFISSEDISQQLGWEKQRVDSVLQRLIREGIVWIDTHHGRQSYWFPSLFHTNSKKSDSEDSSLSIE